METTELFCLVCKTNLEVTPYFDIFYTTLPGNGGLLANFILQVLSCVDSDLGSSHVCSQCFNMLQLLDQTQRSAANILSEILEIYRSSNTKTKRISVSDSFANQKEKSNVDAKCVLPDLKPDLANVDDKFSVKVEQTAYGSFPTRTTHDEESKNLVDKNQAPPTTLTCYPALSRREKMAIYTRQCRVCGRLFKSEKDLESHSLRHVSSISYRCKSCGKSFTDATSARTHAIEEHNDGNSVEIFGDSSAADPTEDNGLLPEELLGMSDDEECDDFVWKEVLHGVDNLGADDERESCHAVVTGQESAQPVDPLLLDPVVNSSKATHKARGIPKYSLKPLKHPCPTCGKKWKTSAELKTHMKSHSTLRPYMCEKCGQAYKHKHALEVHVGMHNGINPYKCNICEKCFTQKGALMRHLPIHTGETPYQCELCGKRFVHHTSYNMHALSHTGKKSYQCHVCDMSLLSTSHLKRHMRAHTGEKPFSCTLCGKRFAERYNLIAHQKIHDPTEIIAKESKKTKYKCEQCELLFDKKQKLDEHSRQHHNFGTESTNERKWVIANEARKPYASQTQFTTKLDKFHTNETWRQENCAKTDGDSRIPEIHNPIAYPIGTNSLTLALENHKMLIDVSCNRGLVPTSERQQI